MHNNAPIGIFDSGVGGLTVARAIADVLEDLSAGRPMDRLICGDVGFGKTEIALRAAFVVAMSGAQVAVVVAQVYWSR